MRPIRTSAVLATALALVPAAGFAQSNFEGSVAYSMTMAQGMTIDMTQYVKGDRMRMEMAVGPMGNMVTLVDLSKGTTTMLMPAQKTYMTMDASTMQAQAGADTNKDNADFSVERTGETETVAGYKCENVNVTANDQVIHYCITTELGYFFGAASSGGRMGGGGRGGMGAGQTSLSDAARDQIRKEFPKGFFPLKMGLTANGMQMTMTATKVEKKSLSNDLFEVPSDYTAMSMGGRGGPGGN
jgi:Domain of unknown function (DUF4412)